MSGESARLWREALAERFGRAVRVARANNGWTAAELSARTAAAGFPIHRIAISKIENGQREGKVDLAEVISLATALGITPVQLLFPDDGRVEVWPGVEMSNPEALQWFSGQITGAQRKLEAIRMIIGDEH